MTDTDNICRVMAEQICDNIADYTDHQGMRDNDIELIYNGIRNHTIVPEIINAAEEYLAQTIRAGVPMKEYNARKRLQAVLDKGRK